MSTLIRPEVALLDRVCWLEIHGLISSRMLSPKTTYTAYLVMGYDRGAFGIDYPPADVSVKLGNQVSEHTASLQSEQDVWRPLAMQHRRHAGNAADDAHASDAARIPQPRSDGWVEIEPGECCHDEGDEGEVDMSLKDIKGCNWERGIVIEGIEMKPKAPPIV